MNKVLSLSFACLSFAAITVAQETSLAQNQVDEEFTNLIENSNDYQGYKVVDYNELVNLKNTANKHFTSLNEEIITQRNNIDQQQEEINNLRAQLEETQKNLQDVTADKDAITFLGMPFSKGAYMSIMWGIVGILLLALLFFIYRYNSSHAKTKEAREKLHVTEKEFEAYRAKALEKEQRLGRLLQDERNKFSD